VDRPVPLCDGIGFGGQPCSLWRCLCRQVSTIYLSLFLFCCYFLGEKLKAIYEARLAYLFPGKPCIVEFYKPDDEQDLEAYQLSFWQEKHEPETA